MPKSEILLHEMQSEVESQSLNNTKQTAAQSKTFKHTTITPDLDL